jgi:hypothetical protein
MVGSNVGSYRMRLRRDVGFHEHELAPPLPPENHAAQEKPSAKAAAVMAPTHDLFKIVR